MLAAAPALGALSDPLRIRAVRLLAREPLHELARGARHVRLVQHDDDRDPAPAQLAEDALLDAFHADPRPEQRRAIAAALGRAGGRAALALLERIGLRPLRDLTPAVLGGFIAESSHLGRTGLRDRCGVLRVFLRYLHRERLGDGQFLRRFPCTLF